MAWRPSGLIATGSQLPTGKRISFVEPNGLPHYDFALQNQNVHMVHIAYNCNGSVLALQLRQDGKDHVQFWTTSNYKWFLKQEIPLDGKCWDLHWDREKPEVIRMLHGTFDRV
jgi:elongator complex protein 1